MGFDFAINLRPIANRSMGGKEHEEVRLER